VGGIPGREFRGWVRRAVSRVVRKGARQDVWSARSAGTVRRVRWPRNMNPLNIWLRSLPFKRLPSPHLWPCVVLPSSHCTASAVSELAHGSDPGKEWGLAAVRLPPRDPESVRASYAAVLVALAPSSTLLRKFTLSSPGSSPYM